MDCTLEANIKNHLEKAEERQLEVNDLKHNQEAILKRLESGDKNFEELMEVMKDTSKKVTETLIILNGSEHNYKDGVVYRVGQHEKIVQRFFGVIGVITFFGISGIIAICIIFYKGIKHLLGMG